MGISLKSLQQIVDEVSEGIICIDRESRINYINDRAKDIFGITSIYELGHSSGRLELGDIVVMGDNSLGFDDGGLCGEDLIHLGLQEMLPNRATVAFIGIHGSEAYCKYEMLGGGGNGSSPLVLQQQVKGIACRVEINFLTKTIILEANGTVIPYTYVKGIGHAMILDGATGQLKFYQSKGYTVRGEDLKAIFTGKPFMEKIRGKRSQIDVIGGSIREILQPSRSLTELESCARGTLGKFENQYDEINSRPLRCSIFPIGAVSGRQEPEGACLKFEDLSDLRQLMDEKDQILRKLAEIDDFERDAFSSLIGESQSITKLKEYARKAALSSANVLLLGESGTGKSVLAGMIHQYSSRKNNPFVEVNCGAISESLLESELFGYVKGAFTGANPKGKIGLIESSDGGTLFLDEISELPVSLQVKLLHVIQSKWFIPVGGTKAVKVDLRLISASNRDLNAYMKTGAFREDLFYRINVIPMVIPPLRERREDLHYLTVSIIHKICRRDGINYKTVSNAAFNKLYMHDFPGNVRELENILERGVHVSEGNCMNEGDILLNLEPATSLKYGEDVPLQSSAAQEIHIEQTWMNGELRQGRTMKDILEDAECFLIRQSLKVHHGDKKAAMGALGIQKTAFYEKIKKYQLE